MTRAGGDGKGEGGAFKKNALKLLGGGDTIHIGREMLCLRMRDFFFKAWGPLKNQLLLYRESAIALQGVRNDMALKNIRHGSERSPSFGLLPVEAETSRHRLQIPQRSMTDCSHSHDKLLLEP